MASGPWGEDWEAGERGRGLAIDIAKLNGAYHFEGRLISYYLLV